MPLRYSHSKFVRFSSAETSETPVQPRCSSSKFVRDASAETSETAVKLRFSSTKFVRFSSAETSETAVPLSLSVSKFVRLARGDTLDIIGFVRHLPSIRVSPRFNPVRLTACSRPVRAAIPRPAVSSSVKLRIASAVIAAPGGSSRASRITAANSASGIETSACTGGAVNCAKAVNNRVKVKSVNFFIWISPYCIGTRLSLLLKRVDINIRPHSDFDARRGTGPRPTVIHR